MLVEWKQQNKASPSKRPQRKLFVSPKKPLKKKKLSSDDHKLDTAWNTAVFNHY